MFIIYHSEYNPDDLTGVVGGELTSTPLSGYIDELFRTVEAPPSGLEEAAYQYRKVFVKNEHDSNSTNVRAWIDALEHSGQIAMAVGTNTDTSYVDEEPTVSDWYTPTNYSDGISLGDLSIGSYTGIWIRQTLSGISVADPYATFRIYVGGLVL